MKATKKWIAKNLANGNFRLSVHAAERIKQRCILESDLRCCGRTAKKIEFQFNKNTWKILGKDLDGDKLTIICTIKENILIVTTY